MFKFSLQSLLMGLILILFSGVVYAQNDSLVMNTGDVIVGEIKKLSLGILEIETDYSDEDFKIEWSEVEYIKTEQVFIITLSKGERYNGSMESMVNDSGMVIIHKMDSGEVITSKQDIVFFKVVDRTFISRMDLLISLGYTLTKANNSNQFSIKFEAGYLAHTFGANIRFNHISNFQKANDTVDIRSYRTEAGAGVQLFLVKDWFVSVGTDLLQSSEQKLNLRALTKMGIGKYLVSTNAHYFVIVAGGAWNFENYSDAEGLDRNSLEAYAGIEYNIFDMGDLDLKTTLIAYPGLTEWGRFRSDFNFDLSYDFFEDFFINLGFILNYDNQPIEGASEVDYVFQTTVGWEL